MQTSIERLAVWCGGKLVEAMIKDTYHNSFKGVVHHGNQHV